MTVCTATATTPTHSPPTAHLVEQVPHVWITVGVWWPIVQHKVPVSDPTLLPCVVLVECGSLATGKGHRSEQTCWREEHTLQDAIL